VVKYILRGITVLLLVLSVSAAAAAVWIQSPSGERAASRWLTGQLQPSAPGTRVDLEGVKLHWPPTLTAKQAVWSSGDGQPILLLAPAHVSLAGLRFPPGRSGWEAGGPVTRLDLALLDRAIAGGGWKSDGFLHGSVNIRGRDGRMEDIDLKLESERPGGHLNSKSLEGLAEMLPPDDPRRVPLQMLGAKDVFHFDVGKLDLTTEGEHRVLRLFLDGDHLLDLTVRIPKESKLLFRFLGLKSTGEKR